MLCYYLGILFKLQGNLHLPEDGSLSLVNRIKNGFRKKVMPYKDYSCQLTMN
jgi:hypothetical protein